MPVVRSAVKQGSRTAWEPLVNLDDGTVVLLDLLLLQPIAAMKGMSRSSLMATIAHVRRRARETRRVRGERLSFPRMEPTAAYSVRPITIFWTSLVPS